MGRSKGSNSSGRRRSVRTKSVQLSPATKEGEAFPSMNRSTRPESRVTLASSAALTPDPLKPSLSNQSKVAAPALPPETIVMVYSRSILPVKVPPDWTIPVELLLSAGSTWPEGPESKRWLVPRRPGKAWSSSAKGLAAAGPVGL